MNKLIKKHTLSVRLLFAIALILTTTGILSAQCIPNATTVCITTPAITSAALGVPYTFQMTAQGGAAPGTGPFTWSITLGALPTGLTMSSAGLITGTPTVPGSVTITFGAVDSLNQAAVPVALSLTVQQVTIATPQLQAGVVNGSYNQQLNATGGTPPYTWTSLSPLPPGLTLRSTGLLTGTPTSAGTTTVTISVSDSFSPPQTATQTFTITIAGPVSITTSSLPAGAVGTPYSSTLAATAGLPPYTWSLSSGLPNGLSLSPNGIVSGTPNESGSFTVTVIVTDSSNPAQSVAKGLPLTIAPVLTITTTSPLPVGVVGAFYLQTLASSGTPPLSWSVISGAVPPGLALTSIGSLQGTPNVAGTYDFTVQVAGGTPAQTGTQPLHLVINPGLSITTTNLPNTGLGVPYSFTLSAIGGVAPYTWTNQGNLPPGLSLSSAGVISGTPIGLGSVTFGVQVSDSFTPKQTATHTFTLTVTTALTIVTTSLSSAIQNQPFSQQLQASGTSPFTWVVTSGPLPPGLALATSGLLQGTPTVVGTTTITIAVTDTFGSSATQSYVLAVNPPLSPMSVPSLPATLNPTQVSDINLTLASPNPSDLTGTLTLTFAPKADIPIDDPNTQFSTGTRVANFTIPANTTAAVFSTPISLLIGTAAGTVTLTANIQNGPALAVATVNIPALAPQITSTVATRTAGGIQVQIVGYSSSRRVVSAEFDFDIKGSSQPVAVSRTVETDFNSWFGTVASIPFGGSFSFLQSFTVAGDASTIQSVTVRLTNAQGTTVSKTVTVQ